MTKKFSIEPQQSALKRADALSAAPPAALPSQTPPSQVAPPEAIPREAVPPRGIPGGYTTPVPEGTVPSEGVPVASLPPASIPASGIPEGGTDEGYWPLPNWVSDVMLPRLEPFEQIVMFRLYRLTLGFNRDRCLVSNDKLVSRTRLSKNTVIRTVKKLVADRYVETRLVRTGASGGQALEYRLLPAAIPPGGIPKKGTPEKGPPRPGPMTEERQTKRQADAPASAANVFEIRTIAARLFEAHRGAPGFDRERLRELVTDALIGQGISPSGDVLDEALRGMLI